MDTGQAVNITLIGSGTAFSLLAILWVFTASLPHLSRLIAGATRRGPKPEELSLERARALAAVIAVNAAVAQGHGPDAAPRAAEGPETDRGSGG